MTLFSFSLNWIQVTGLGEVNTALAQEEKYFEKTKLKMFPPPGSDSVLEVVDVGVFALETTCVLGHHPDVGVAVTHSYTRRNSLWANNYCRKIFLWVFHNLLKCSEYSPHYGTRTSS